MREDKVMILDEIQEWVKTSPYLIVTDYTGMRVDEFSELRNRLFDVQAEMHVVKNTYLRKALVDQEIPDMEEMLKGQTAIVFGPSDVCAAAKVLKNFESEFKRPAVKSGVVDRAVLDNKAILQLADLPPREVLLGQLLGLINSPATKLATIIQTPASQLAQVLKAKSEKGE